MSTKAETYPEMLAGILEEVRVYLSEQDNDADTSLSEELNEIGKELQGDPEPAKVGEVMNKAVKWMEGLLEDSGDEDVIKMLERIVKLLKSMPGYPNPAPKTESNSNEEVQRMADELKDELDKAKRDLETFSAEITELKDSVIAKDNKVTELEDQLREVTEAKDAVESELARIEQEKKDAELKQYIEKEVKLGITDAKDEDGRLDALRKLNEDSLAVYVGMLNHTEKAKEDASAGRHTLSGDGDGDSDDDGDGDDKDAQMKEAKAALEKAFGVKPREE